MSIVSSSMNSMLSSSGRKGKRKQEVLSEEDYTAQLEEVIEQQFFPHLPQLRSMLDYLDANETFDITTLRETYKMLFPSLPSRLSESSTTAVSAATGLSTISRGNDSTYDTINSNNSKLTVSQFFSRYISEDNQSYLALQEQAVEAHRRKFHWMYEAVDCLPLLTDGGNSDASAGTGTVKRKAGMLMLYYLGDKVLSAAERQELDHILSKQYDMLDNRPNIHNPHWGFKVRNAMFFPPELQQSREICQVNVEPEKGMLSILPQQPASDQQLMLPPPPKPRQPRVQEKHIQAREIHALSHNLLEDVDAFLRGKPTNNSSIGTPLTPLEDIHTPSTASSFSSDDPRVPFLPSSSAHPKSYREVTMSPMPVVGGRGALASPLMTWGDVGGTPLRLDSSGSNSLQNASRAMGSHVDDGNSGPEFHFLPYKLREQVAMKLAEKLRKKKHVGGGVTPSPSPSPHVHSGLSTPISARGGSSVVSGVMGSSSSARGSERGRLKDLTPAAQQLAQSILKSQKQK